jgi:succinate dehydrogenase / fumarate reductase, cytochrome b subunit
MALTGLALFFFVIGHLIGNLQVFGPPELINSYAHFLKAKPALVWSARIGLLVCVGLHIAAAVSLTGMNREARPEVYTTATGFASTAKSRYMFMSGLVILAFIIYHLAHFTALLPGINGVGDFRKFTVNLNGDIVPDVYAMMVLGFRVWWVVLFYIVAQVLLFMHLGHGVAAMFNSLGWRNHVWWPRITAFAKYSSIAIAAGYILIPLAIFMRVVGNDYAEKRKYELLTQHAPASAVAAAGKETK